MVLSCQNPSAATGHRVRVLTPAIVTAHDRRPKTFSTCSKKKVLSAFKPALPLLNLSMSATRLIEYLVFLTQPTDWSDGNPIAWPSNHTLQSMLGVGHSQLRNLSRELQENGLVVMCDSTNGRRYGRRDEAGHLIEAYGFDLTPLLERVDEFDQLAKSNKAAIAECKKLHTIIVRESNWIVQTCHFAIANNLPGDWKAMTADANRLRSEAKRDYNKCTNDPEPLARLLNQISSLRSSTDEARKLATTPPSASNTVATLTDTPSVEPRTDLDPPTVSPDIKVNDPAATPVDADDQARQPGSNDLATSLSKLQAAIGTHGAGPIPNSTTPVAPQQSEKTKPIDNSIANTQSESQKIALSEPKNWPHITTTNPEIAKTVTTLPPPHLTNTAHLHQGTRESSDPGSALRGYPLTPHFVVAISPAFGALLSHSLPTWDDLLQASFHVRAELGISQDAWGQACRVLGRIEALAALAAIAARHTAGKVRSPGGMLRAMVDRHQQGTLHLDRTLFGLAAGLAN